MSQTDFAAAGVKGDPLQIIFELPTIQFPPVSERAQAIALDKHFAVEQVVRHRADCFPKFNGSAGVWRRGDVVHKVLTRRRDAPPHELASHDVPAHEPPPLRHGHHDPHEGGGADAQRDARAAFAGHVAFGEDGDEKADAANDAEHHARQRDRHTDAHEDEGDPGLRDVGEPGDAALRVAGRLEPELRAGV